jgi:hypothetical protein
MRDSIGFFDCDGLEFPRFMLALPGRVFAEQVKAVMDAFFGTSSTTGQDSQVARKMNELLSRLQSFQSPTNPRHAPIDLCVTLPSSAIANVDPIIQQLNRTSENPTRGSPFHLRQLRFEGLIKFDHDKDTESFSQFVNSSRVPLGPWAISSDIGVVTSTGFAQVLRSILRIDDTHQPAQTTTLAFQHDRLTDTSFQALFSGLPFASSIRSLSLSVRNEQQSFCMRELPWIAYAIFHPCARQSSWRHLELRDLSLTAEAQCVLSAMARGNNLLALLTGEHATSDEYVSGVLEAGSVVFTKPSEFSPPMATITDFKTMTVDLCGVSSTSDRATWNEWVAVVVPGYGLGWARSSLIVSVSGNPASRSQLTGLHLQPLTELPLPSVAEQPSACVSLEPFIQVLGPSLMYLHIGSLGTIPVSTLQRLIVACPTLGVLVAHVAGGTWTSSPCTTQLRELALQLATQKDLAIASAIPVDWLQRLQALRLTVPEMIVFEKNRSSVSRLLSQAPSLHYLHWQRELQGSRHTQPPLSFEASQQQSATKLRKLKLSHDRALLHAQGPFSARCAVAVLSVVNHKTLESDEAMEPNGESAMSRLDPDLLRMIFQFATSPVRRTVCGGRRRMKYSRSILVLQLQSGMGCAGAERNRNEATDRVQGGLRCKRSIQIAF